MEMQVNECVTIWRNKMYTLILLSGGSGSRMKKDMPKQYLLLAGKPVIMHTLERVDKIQEIEEIVIVCENQYVSNIQKMIEQYNIKKSIIFAMAGKTRQASVKSGLEKVHTENVILHEAARPFVSEEDFRTLIMDERENAIYGAPIPFTVLKGNDVVEGILNRSELVNVQLPQKFNTSSLKQAHELAEKDNMNFTEDASLLYYYYPEEKIGIHEGMDYNVKLTTPMDLILGEMIYKEYFARRK